MVPYPYKTVTMESNNTETLLAKWLEHNLSAEEEKSLAEMDGLDELTDFLQKMDQVSIPNMDMEQAWTILAKKTVHKPVTIKTNNHRSLFPTILKTAAAVALIVGVGLWYARFVIPKHFYAQFGEVATVELPDGSTVSLNAGSELSYSRWQWRKARQVNLAGEAYFKVAKGEQFTVVTRQGEVKVLGTQFDVFDRAETYQVKCFEGRVQVISNQQETILTKGEGVKIAHQITTPLKVAKSEAWLDGQSRFFENSLIQVFNELERQYGIKVDFEKINKEKQFTGVLPNNNLDKALSLLCDAMNLTYHSNDKNIKISNK